MSDTANEVNQKLYKDFFFHKEIISQTENAFDEDEIQVLSGKENITPYLQTALLEEHLIEVDIAHLTRDFFTLITDEDAEALDQRLESENSGMSSSLEFGDYLKESDFFLTSPLSPGMGNVSIRHYKTAVLKYYTGTQAVELGCTLREVQSATKKSCLVFNFPKIGRVIKGFRSFRVKVLSSVDAKVSILGDDGCPSFTHCQLEDLSVSGVGFLIPEEKPALDIGQVVRVRVDIEGCGEFSINGLIRRLVPVRNGQGMNTICGLQFDLETGAMAKTVELMVTAVQRLHLRELADKMSGMSGVRIIR